tara:strand:+ start:2547 stop:3761 length:1215 start_codon:yes stop_codon:yes gene_type:complete
LKTYKKSSWILFFGLIIFSFGVYLSFLRGPHFSDGDSYSIINSFLIFLDTGVYKPSRGAYGYPIPEIILGFVAYNFGVSGSNILSFVFFYFSIFFIAFSFVEKQKMLFILLVFSNSILFIDNTNTLDYSFSLFFFSLGFFFLPKSILISSIFFAFSIASRANFALFIYPSLLIYFYFIEQKENKVKFKRLFISFAIITSIGLAFYIPVFIANEFSISFIKIPILTKNSSPGWYGGPELSFISLFPRFIYKIYKILGVFSSIIIFYLIIINFFKFKLINKNNLIIFFIIGINLIIFFFMPTKYLIINPFVIFLYAFIANSVSKKFLKILIFFNILQWIVSYSIIEIKYKNKTSCDAQHAISAKYTFQVDNGYLSKFFKSLNTAQCYEKNLGRYSNNFINNYKLKN